MDTLGEAQENYFQAKLEPFLTTNPEAALEAVDGGLSIVRPWGEEAIQIPLRIDDTELLDILNAVRLPSRFTAIWHEDSKEFEIIASVLRKGHPLLDRSFDFHYKGRSYECSFGPSSSRLRVIARRARPAGEYWGLGSRNLQSYHQFERLAEENSDRDSVKNGRPTSFWIRGLDDFDNDYIENLVRNLNFHMSYFDRQTPIIMIHEDAASFDEAAYRHRPNIDTFPLGISAQDIDQHLLVLWENAQDGDPFLRFIRYYQILEYAGFYHVKAEILQQVKRAVAAPDALSRSEDIAQQIIDAISAERKKDTHKIDAMIKACVDPQQMWDIMEGSLPKFSEDITLDGGFVLPALVSASNTYEDFAHTWNQTFSNALHKVRNALVHAREYRQSTTISPTIANRARLSVWLLPLSETAARVMLYSSL